MRSVTLPSGERVPALGIGTWRMGENRTARAEELATLRLALDHGVSVIDTAEMYGEGLSEMLVGEAIAGRRDDAFLVSKVYPHNATRHGTAAACERSLLRLRTDRIDLYLLHWRGSVPLAETLNAFQALQRDGKIRYYGVSNFGMTDLRELWTLPAGRASATDQLLYNLLRRSIEWDVLPWARERHLPIMAYSPLEQARLIQDPRLVGLAQRFHLSPAQAALAWLLAQDDVIAIPKTANRERLRENLGALDESLTSAQLRELEQAFPRPAGPRPLETL
ncbi:MAG TPA: aldo/keto reductase [Steroidobacteraceae bacterium]|nr:aldo/keto reductase [Steroidobacteraceae bacterium]